MRSNGSIFFPALSYFYFCSKKISNVNVTSAFIEIFLENQQNNYVGYWIQANGKSVEIELE